MLEFASVLADTSAQDFALDLCNQRFFSRFATACSVCSYTRSMRGGLVQQHLMAADRKLRPQYIRVTCIRDIRSAPSDEQRMLSLASCVLRSEVATPAQSLLLQEMKSDVVHVRDEPHFGVAVKKVADRWQVELPVDKSSLRTHRSRLITSDWQARPEHAVLRSLTTNAFSGMYLHTDYPDVRFRSHFRFGMAPTAKRRAYFDASVHPACPRCGAPEQSISHVLADGVSSSCCSAEPADCWPSASCASIAQPASR